MDQGFPAIFVGDAPGLDFLNSIATPVDTPVDRIADGKGLLDWLEQAQLVPADVLRNIRAQALPGELDAAADQARRLREWFRAFVQKHKGRPLGRKDLDELDPLNRLLDRDEAFTRIVARREKQHVPFELQYMRRWRSPDALLLPIGEAIAQFVCAQDFSNVKASKDRPVRFFLPTTREVGRGAGAAWRYVETGRNRPPTVIGSNARTPNSNERFESQTRGNPTLPRYARRHRASILWEHQFRHVAIISQFAFDEGVEGDRVTRLR